MHEQNNKEIKFIRENIMKKQYAKNGIFESVEFLDEGLFGLGSKSIYSVYSYEIKNKDDINLSIFGLASEKEAIKGFLKSTFVYRNNSYIVSPNQNNHNFYLYRFDAKLYTKSLQTANENYSRKVLCAKNKDIISYHLIKKFDSVEDLAKIISIKINVEDNGRGRKEVIRELKAAIRNLNIKRLTFGESFDIEQFVDGYNDSVLIAEFDVSEEDSANSQIMNPIEELCDSFNKNHKSYEVYLDWNKYEGTYFLRAK